MRGDVLGTRHLLLAEAALLPKGLLFIGLPAAAYFEWQAGALDPGVVAGLVLGAAFLAIIIWFASISLEATDEAVYIHGFRTLRIPLEQVEAVDLVKPSAPLEWTQRFSAFERGWAPGKGFAPPYFHVIVIHTAAETYALEFWDPDHAYAALRHQWEKFRKAE